MAGSRRFRRFAAIAPLCWVMLQAASAAAQSTSSDKAAAEALFDQGVRLMKQNSFAEACPKLEESERIDPAVGTLLYLGECYERVGKTASAWATFREAASLAATSNQGDRARVANSRAQDIEPKLSRLSVELAPEVAKIPGVVVKRGAQRVEPSLYGTPLPVDPGEYRIEVSAPGYETWSTPIKVEAGGASASVRVPGLVKGSEPAASAAPVTDAPRGPDEKPRLVTGPLAPLPGRGLTTQQTLGLVVGTVGVIGVGIGSYFGVRAVSNNSDAERFCRDNLCAQQGIELTEKARRDAVASNIAFAAGGALVAIGGLVFLTGGGEKDTERVALVPVLGPRTAAATISGSF